MRSATTARAPVRERGEEVALGAAEPARKSTPVRQESGLDKQPTG